MGRPAHPPADDAAGIGVGDKGEVSLSGHVGSRATFRSSAGDKSAATVGLPATLAAIGSGIGSSLALIRTAIGAERRRSSSAANTRSQLTITRFTAAPPAPV